MFVVTLGRVVFGAAALMNSRPPLLPRGSKHTYTREDGCSTITYWLCDNAQFSMAVAASPLEEEQRPGAVSAHITYIYIYMHIRQQSVRIWTVSLVWFHGGRDRGLTLPPKTQNRKRITPQSNHIPTMNASVDAIALPSGTEVSSSG